MARSATPAPCDAGSGDEVKVVVTEKVLLDEYAGFWPKGTAL